MHLRCPQQRLRRRQLQLLRPLSNKDYYDSYGTTFALIPLRVYVNLTCLLLRCLSANSVSDVGTIISVFLLVVFRLVIVLSLPLFFIGSMYAFMWFPQIYRAVRRGRTSGLKAEYLIGVTLCRLYFLLCMSHIGYTGSSLMPWSRLLGLSEKCS